MERPWSKGRRALAAAAVVLTALLGGSATAQIAEVGNGGPGPVKAEHLTAELTALSPQIAVGGTLQVGLVLTIQEGWHVYWINAGDSGEPPAIHWTLPKGVTAGPMQFPPPSRLPLGPLMDFGYQDSVAFPVRLTASPTLHPGKLHLDAHVSWLVCSSVCLPGKAHLGMDLEAVKGPLPKPAEVGALGTALAELPSPLSDGMSAEAVTDAKQILVTFKTGSRETSAQIYPYDSEVIENAAAQRVESLSDGAIALFPQDALDGWIHGVDLVAVLLHVSGDGVAGLTRIIGQPDDRQNAGFPLPSPQHLQDRFRFVHSILLRRFFCPG